MIRHILVISTIGLCVACTADVGSKESDFQSFLNDAALEKSTPEQTTRAVGVLVRAGDDIIASKSSCSGQFGLPRISDLLAAFLSGMDAGTNRIRGVCDTANGERCTLVLDHANEEDVWSAQIAFAITDGTVRSATLSCILP